MGLKEDLARAEEKGVTEEGVEGLTSNLLTPVQ